MEFGFVTSRARANRMKVWLRRFPSSRLFQSRLTGTRYPGRLADVVFTAGTFPRVLRYLTPLLLTAVLLVECYELLDLMSTGGDVSAANESAILLFLSRSRTAAILLLGVLVTGAFLLGDGKAICECLIVLEEVKSNTSLKTVENKKSNTTRQTRLRVCSNVPCLWLIFVGVGVAHCLHRSWVISTVWIQATGNGDVEDAFFPTKWRTVYRQATLFLSETLILPIDIFYVMVCRHVRDLAAQFNTVLYEMVRLSRRDTVESAVSRGPSITSEVLAYDVKLVKVIVSFEDAFRLLLGALVLGNFLLLVSLTSNLFVTVAGAGGEPLLDDVFFATTYGSALVIFLLILVPSIQVHETYERGTILWAKLNQNREKAAEKVGRCRDNRDSTGTLTMLMRTLLRPRNITVAGAGNITRSFGLSLLAGFLGLFSFLVDRAEQSGLLAPVPERNTSRSSLDNTTAEMNS